MVLRLDLYVQENRNHNRTAPNPASRASCQKFLKQFGVRLNGKLMKKPHVIVREKDSVEIDEAAWDKFSQQELSGESALISQLSHPHRAPIFSGESFFVIDKPAGVKTEDFAQSIGDGRSCLPVHRLDKDTSGVLVIAKNAAAKAQLQKQWQDRRVKKCYLTLLKGNLTPNKGAVSAGIGRSMYDRTKMAVSAFHKARAAYTEYRVVHRLPEMSLVLAFPETGRTHQIRVHFASIGHPVIGDELYGDKKLNEEFCEKYGLARQFLHAASLKLKNPETKKMATFRAPLARDLHDVLEKLGVDLRDLNV